jgi:hypothetical protein
MAFQSTHYYQQRRCTCADCMRGTHQHQGGHMFSYFCRRKEWVQKDPPARAVGIIALARNRQFVKTMPESLAFSELL